MCWKRWVGITGAAALGGAGLIASAMAYVNAMPVQVTLAPESCVDTSRAKPYGFMASDKLPCRFTAYPFRSRDGWVVIGASTNVKDQCLRLPRTAIDLRSAKVVLGAAPRWNMTDACYASYAVYSPVKSRDWIPGKLLSVLGG